MKYVILLLLLTTTAPLPANPITPIKTKIGIHRGAETVCYLDFRNNDSKRTVIYLEWWVIANDLYRKEETGRFRFWGEPVIPVRPNETGYIMDELVDRFPATECSNYGPAIKTRIKRESDQVFLPARCSTDHLWVIVTHVKYQDGSEYRLLGWN